MPTQVQFRRGTTAQNAAFTGAAGEITINTSNVSLRVHDGSTAGGTELATLAFAANATVLTTGTLPAARLPTSGATANTYGGAATVPVTVIDTYGRATAVSNVAIAIAGDAITSGTVAAGRLPTTLTSGTAVTNAGLTTPTILTGATNLGWFQEKANISASGFSATQSTFSLADGPVHYLTGSSTANSAVNLQGFSSLNTANVTSMVVAITNGATPYYISSVQIDGVTANVTKWAGGAAPSGGNASNIDVYAFSVIKTATSTYTVLAQQTKFGP